MELWVVENEVSENYHKKSHAMAITWKVSMVVNDELKSCLPNICI